MLVRFNPTTPPVTLNGHFGTKGVREMSCQGITTVFLRLLKQTIKHPRKEKALSNKCTIRNNNKQKFLDVQAGYKHLTVHDANVHDHCS